MVARLALHGLEWLAVAAATLMGLAAFAEPSALTLAACFAPAYVVDDHTVAKTSNSGARPVAGTIFDVDAQGVWVRFA